MKENKNNHYENINLYNEEAEEQIRYMKEEENKAKKRYILIFIFFFVALVCLGCGITSYYYKINSLSPHSIDVNNLFVVHSNTSFGSEINNFNAYTSEEKSYKYTFYVDNQNQKEVSYQVSVIDVEDGLIDKTKVGYALYKNNNLVFRGVLTNDRENILTTTKLNSSAIDNYELRLWGISSIEGSYKFKVRVFI